jgi:tRNA 2-thiocytidine biosynthesis protein TtcA
LELLRLYGRRLPFDFEVTAVNVDQGHPGFPAHVLRDYFEAHDYAYRIEYQDTHSVVVEQTPAGKAFCSLCSRMRRGILYRVAAEIGATKIALGHHRDDLIETLLLNQFFAGRTRSMPARLEGQPGQPAIIRPLALCAEASLATLAAERGYPVVPCDLCGSQENLQRQKMKALLAQLEVGHPELRGNLLAALGNVEPTHLLDARVRRVVDADVADQRAGDSTPSVRASGLLQVAEPPPQDHL